MSKPIGIVVADYYPEIVCETFAHCLQTIRAGGRFEVQTVRAAGALEISQAACQRWQVLSDQPAISGLIGLGCVIRGETSHYDIVATQSAYWLNWLAHQRGLPVSNGILTCENKQQARARAQSHGIQAAKALLGLLKPLPYDGA